MLIGLQREGATAWNIGDIQAVIATAIGGMTITQTVEGRERYGVRVRYLQELRNTPERLADVLVPVMHATGGNMGGLRQWACRRAVRSRAAP